MTTAVLFAAILAAQSAAAATPAPPPASPAPPVRQTDWPPVSYFTADDYPAGALRAEAEGTTGYRIEIGPDGRVSGCTITASSGSIPLDTTTCRILRTRTRFRPARDSAGNAVPDAREGEVTWRMERSEQ